MTLVENIPFWSKNRVHHGIVLDTSSKGFDRGSVTSGSVFVDQDDPNNLFLFYSGASDATWSHSAIGLATSSDGFEFRRVGKGPVLEGPRDSFCFKEALAPAVTRVGNRFYMIFSGKPSPMSYRRLGVAYADDPRGPWNIIGELIKPESLWEGRDLDNGPSIVKLNNETILVYYSNITSFPRRDIFTLLRRYPIRRIGILKVRLRGASMSSIQVYKFSGNPLKHLNGPKGSWNESVFCPGYLQLGSKHFLFPTTSTYSTGFPYKQCIGFAVNSSPYFSRGTTLLEKLIDGPSEKLLINSQIKSEIALDTPSPLLKTDKKELFLYYSVMDRSDGVWKVALTTFALDDKAHKRSYPRRSGD